MTRICGAQETGETGVARVLALADGSRTAAELARMAGVAISYVYQLRHRHPDRVRLARGKGLCGGRNLSLADVNAIIAGIERGEPLADLARRFGCSRQRVSQIALSAGLRRRYCQLAHLPLSVEVRDWLLRQVPDGASAEDMVAAIVTDAFLEEAGEVRE